jgi:hypothetical protein
VSRVKFAERIKARRAAREIWIARRSDPTVADLVAKTIDGDEEAGKLLFGSHPELVGIDPATLLLLIQIALRLWLWWQSQKLENPSEDVAVGEPFDMTVSDDDQD